MASNANYAIKTQSFATNPNTAPKTMFQKFFIKREDVSNVLIFLLFFFIFYYAVYGSVSSIGPTAIPVHHDDYSNYALRLEDYSFSVRPLSTLIIALLSTCSPEALIWSVRILTVLYFFLSYALYASLVGERSSWVVGGLCAIAVFSSPIVAEYARYTGMITHLISGCFGICATLVLRKAFTKQLASLALASGALILASIFAKEDFFILFVFSYCYFFKLIKTTRSVRWIAVGAICVAAIAILGFKVLTTTVFLGVSDTSSTYYVNILPLSIIRTGLDYLGGARNPAFAIEGYIVTCLFFLSLVFGLVFLIKKNLLPLYLLGCAVSIIIPYAVLPNHVNAYYQYLWLPFIFFAAFLSIRSIFQAIPRCPMLGWVNYQILAIIVLLGIVVLLWIVNYPRRTAIAAWYDKVGAENMLVLDKIQEFSRHTSSGGILCVVGANAFSPWYMHSGLYLDRVMNIHRDWMIIVPDQSPLRAGFAIGAVTSKGKFSVSTNNESHDCNGVIDLH